MFPFNIDMLAKAIFNSNDAFKEKISIEALIGLPALMTALLIPVAIFMMNEETLPWDKQVILNLVVKAKVIFASFIVMGIIPFLWKVEHAQTVLVFLELICLFMLIRAFVEIYQWYSTNEPRNNPLGNYRAAKRNEYLSQLSERDMEIVWSSTWSYAQNNPGIVDVRQYVPIFIEQLNKMSDKDFTGMRLLIDFTGYLGDTKSVIVNGEGHESKKLVPIFDLRDPLIHSAIIDFCMPWVSNIWSNEKPSSYAFVDSAARLFEELMKNDMSYDHGAWQLFHGVTKYLDRNGVNKSFIDYFATNFLQIYGELENSRNIWRSFPSNWLITIEHLENETLKMPVLCWLQAYLMWIFDRPSFFFATSNYDSKVDDVTQNLFPKIDPILWSSFLYFHRLPFAAPEDDERIEYARIRSFIELRPMFGGMGRVTSFWGDNSHGSIEAMFRDLEREQEEETVALVRKLPGIFPIFTDRQQLHIYIQECEEMHFEDDFQQNKLEYLMRILHRFLNEFSEVEEIETFESYDDFPSKHDDSADESPNS
ncbi:MAG: hypothetical protein U0R17_04105 [Acidimicrobiia bacterium]